ncbi:vWA domain-containing protein [Poriferisphaera corsica]|nr:vWA domain-containing protein [Poriferisphaera corsica]
MRAAILLPILSSLILSAPLSAKKIAQQSAPTTTTTTIPAPATAESIEITIEVKPTPPSIDNPNLQIAILLDTSSSMSGLINQAKAQLWTIVNQCGKATYNGLAPNLTIAIFEYGNSGLPASEGYIRQVLPFTNDLDAVSQALFSLTTNGGDEYCGLVINEAIKRLDWSTNPDDYRAIYIAGNEPFTQGQFPFSQACSTAKSKDIIVNTIHCGDANEGINGSWQAGAILAAGKYLNINHDRQVANIKTPYDDKFLELNSQINGTYLYFGVTEVRRSRAQNQLKQDKNMMNMGGMAIAERVASKSKKQVYNNSGRDLVDTFGDKDKLEELATVATEELPKAMQAMTPEQRIEHVKITKEEREKIQKQIAELEMKRQAFIAEKRKELAKDTLGDVITQTITTQLTNNGFAIETTTIEPELQIENN